MSSMQRMFVASSLPSGAAASTTAGGSIFRILQTFARSSSGFIGLRT